MYTDEPWENQLYSQMIYWYYLYTWETLLDLVAELECDLMPYLTMFYVSCAWSYGYTHVAMAIPLMLLFF